MLEHIFGAKTSALTDIWTFEHILSGISIGHLIRNRSQEMFAGHATTDIASRLSGKFDVSCVLLVAYLWEAIEHYLETGLAGRDIEHWFMGVEYWGNRLLFDPVAMLGGYLLATRFTSLVTPSRLLSACWLSAHILLFPDSMYLQRRFFGIG